MLLTKTRDGATAARPRLRRLSGASLPTMDRRTFLKRFGSRRGGRGVREPASVRR